MSLDPQLDELQSQPGTSEQQDWRLKASFDQDNHHSKNLTDDGDELWYEDESQPASNNDYSGEAPELDREWEKRHRKFHTAGYRDGLMAGKEKFAQDGFNEGFKQSVLVGHNFGLVRGITSALASLPDHLKEKIVEKSETRNELQNLCNHVHSISSKDAMKLFYEDIVDIQAKQSPDCVKGGLTEVSDSPYDISDCPHLSKFSKEMQLLLELPSVHVHGAEQKGM